MCLRRIQYKALSREVIGQTKVYEMQKIGAGKEAVRESATSSSVRVEREEASRNKIIKYWCRVASPVF